MLLLKKVRPSFAVKIILYLLQYVFRLLARVLSNLSPKISLSMRLNLLLCCFAIIWSFLTFRYVYIGQIQVTISYNITQGVISEDLETQNMSLTIFLFNIYFSR